MVNTFQSANDLPEPSEILDEREMSYYIRVVKSREVTTWSDHDIAIATNLAMTQVQYLDAMAAIKRDGRTTINDRGTPVANPETAAMNQLSASVRAFTATLGLSASQRGMTNDSQRARSAADRQARTVIEKVKDDSLLA